MISRSEYIEYHWNDYMMHERHFADLCDYVALQEQNLKTCSDEIISQLLLICTSFEASMKAMYTFSPRHPDVNDYLDALHADSLFDDKVEIRLLEGKLDSAIKPFEGACRDNSPVWWKAHNDLKHNRTEYYAEGTFGHLLDALAALYYVNMIHVKKIGDYWHEMPGLERSDDGLDVPNDTSRFFVVEGWKTRDTVFARNAYAINSEDIDCILNTH